MKKKFVFDGCISFQQLLGALEFVDSKEVLISLSRSRYNELLYEIGTMRPHYKMEYEIEETSKTICFHSDTKKVTVVKLGCRNFMQGMLPPYGEDVLLEFNYV